MIVLIEDYYSTKIVNLEGFRTVTQTANSDGEIMWYDMTIIFKDHSENFSWKDEKDRDSEFQSIFNALV